MLMNRTPLTTAGDPSPILPVMACHSGAHFLPVAVVEQSCDPAAS